MPGPASSTTVSTASEIALASWEAPQPAVRSKVGSRPGDSRTVALSVAEPGFRTRIRNGLGSLPAPVADLRRVLAVLARVGSRSKPLVLEVLPQRRCVRAKPRHPVDDVHREMEPVEVVPHDHVER